MILITWTFDLTALFIGWVVGMLMGVLVVALSEMREGGSWSKGFFQGCDAQFLINYLKREKEEMKNARKG